MRDMGYSSSVRKIAGLIVMENELNSYVISLSVPQNEWMDI